MLSLTMAALNIWSSLLMWVIYTGYSSHSLLFIIFLRVVGLLSYIYITLLHSEYLYNSNIIHVIRQLMFGSLKSCVIYDGNQNLFLYQQPNDRHTQHTSPPCSLLKICSNSSPIVLITWGISHMLHVIIWPLIRGLNHANPLSLIHSYIC